MHCNLYLHLHWNEFVGCRSIIDRHRTMMIRCSPAPERPNPWGVTLSTRSARLCTLCVWYRRRRERRSNIELIFDRVYLFQKRSTSKRHICSPYCIVSPLRPDTSKDSNITGHMSFPRSIWMIRVNMLTTPTHAAKGRWGIWFSGGKLTLMVCVVLRNALFQKNQNYWFCSFWEFNSMTNDKTRVWCRHCNSLLLFLSFPIKFPIDAKWIDCGPKCGGGELSFLQVFTRELIIERRPGSQRGVIFAFFVKICHVFLHISRLIGWWSDSVPIFSVFYLLPD